MTNDLPVWLAALPMTVTSAGNPNDDRWPAGLTVVTATIPSSHINDSDGGAASSLAVGRGIFVKQNSTQNW
jgi:hypothetical protein